VYKDELPVDTPHVLLHSDVPFILNYDSIPHIAFLSVRSAGEPRDTKTQHSYQRGSYCERCWAGLGWGGVGGDVT